MTQTAAATRRKLEERERRAEALQMRARGMNYAEIGDALGVSATTAWRDVDAALDAYPEYADVDRMRSMQSAEHAVIRRAMYPRIMNGDIAAAQTILRLQEREAKLYGLDAPPPEQNIRVDFGRWSDDELVSFLASAAHEAGKALPDPPALGL